MTIPGLDTRPALADILPLLQACALPTDDLADARNAGRLRLLAVRRDDAVIAAVALESLGDVALLRSLAVAPDHRGAGIARSLVRFAEQLLYSRNIDDVYLLTTGDGALFAALGYTASERSGAPASVRSNRQFAALCPASATLMHKRLGGAAPQAMAYRPPGPLMANF